MTCGVWLCLSFCDLCVGRVHLSVKKVLVGRRYQIFLPQIPRPMPIVATSDNASYVVLRLQKSPLFRRFAHSLFSVGVCVLVYPG